MSSGDFSRPTYLCSRAGAESAKWVSLNGNSFGPVAFETRARLFWDDEYLHCEFECEDDGHCCTLTGYNDEIYTQDVVELFISEDDGSSYIEIEVSPVGALLHYYIRNDLKGKFWGFARIEQVIHPKVVPLEGPGRPWRAQFSLPLGEFVKAPRSGDSLLFNLYRIKRLGSGPEYSAFSPTQVDNFHVPERFGVLRFE